MVHEKNAQGAIPVVLEMTGTSMQLMTTIRGRQLGHLGRILRGINFEKYCLIGVVEGTGTSGRPILKNMDGIITLVRCRTVGEVFRLAEDRGRWRSIVSNINSEDATSQYGRVRLNIQSFNKKTRIFNRFFSRFV